VLSNFARVKLEYVPQRIWGDQACVAEEVIEEYQAGVKAGRLPSVTWAAVRVLKPSREEKAFEQTMPQILGSGERTSLAIAFNRRAAIATDDALARRVARNLGISTTGTIGILQRAVQREILSNKQAQRALDEMIAAGYYSPISNLDLD
jgi:predicted nucleic acid-binding protein